MQLTESVIILNQHNEIAEGDVLFFDYAEGAMFVFPHETERRLCRGVMTAADRLRLSAGTQVTALLDDELVQVCRS